MPEKLMTTKLDLRISNELNARILSDSKASGKNKSTVARNILEEHYKIVKTRTFKELKERLEQLTPDFQEQTKVFLNMVEKLNEYTQTNNKIHSYIAEQKSAESYYFREIKDQMEEIKDRNEYLEKSFEILLEGILNNKPPTKDGNAADVGEDGSKSDDIVKRLFS